MSRYTIRVELHGADLNDYLTLHAMMELEGFSRTILGDNGIIYELPPGEYDRDCALTVEQVRESAIRAASTNGKMIAVFVTEAGNRAWYGLQQVVPAPVPNHLFNPWAPLNSTHEYRLPLNNLLDYLSKR